MADYIKREAAIRVLLNDSPEQVGYSREDAADCIRYMDAADVAPVRHGWWFDTGAENETGNIYFCSVCNKYHNPNKKDVQMKHAKEKPAYCPNCGAKMDGDGNG